MRRATQPTVHLAIAKLDRGQHDVRSGEMRPTDSFFRCPMVTRGLASPAKASQKLLLAHCGAEKSAKYLLGAKHMIEKSAARSGVKVDRSITILDLATWKSTPLSNLQV